MYDEQSAICVEELPDYITDEEAEEIIEENIEKINIKCASVSIIVIFAPGEAFCVCCFEN